jgi:hypothetical protein
LTALTSLVDAKPAAKKVQKAIKPTAQATMTEATRPKVEAKTAAKPVADKKKVAAKKAVK